jgi:hypothetical protein
MRETRESAELHAKTQRFRADRRISDFSAEFVAGFAKERRVMGEEEKRESQEEAVARGHRTVLWGGNHGRLGMSLRNDRFHTEFARPLPTLRTVLGVGRSVEPSRNADANRPQHAGGYSERI